MRAATVLLAILLLVPVACVQKTETHRSSDETTTVETSTTTTTTPYSVDTTATAEMKEGAQDAAAKAAEAGRDAANATGTALEQAGKDIQKHAKPGDQK